MVMPVAIMVPMVMLVLMSMVMWRRSTADPLEGGETRLLAVMAGQADAEYHGHAIVQLKITAAVHAVITAGGEAYGAALAAREHGGAGAAALGGDGLIGVVCHVNGQLARFGHHFHMEGPGHAHLSPVGVFLGIEPGVVVGNGVLGQG